ncbi:hypothetical protein MNBD_GAMMA08-2471 [hydrothermal vent metagenome]|uniref:Uncharacterized protein n=1 Tax=hydrothermal vent metagenome TaxID=652676 RepID=A0A3B0XE82_9ZZZZ
MKKILILLAVLVLSMSFIERQSGYCGAGWWHPELPFGVQADWFNGAFILNDAEGWGVITSVTKLQGSDSKQISNKRILRYSYNSNVYAEIESTDNNKYYAIIDQPGFLNHQLVAYSDEEFEEYKNKVPTLDWISVEPRSCFFGLFTAAKITIGLVMIILIGILVMQKRRHA